MSNREGMIAHIDVKRKYLKEGFRLYGRIPTSTKDAILDWALHRIPPEGFVEAVLCNDLTNAVGRADSENLRALSDTVKFLYNWVPSACWGSVESYNRWMASTEYELSPTPEGE